LPRPFLFGEDVDRLPNDEVRRSGPRLIDCSVHKISSVVEGDHPPSIDRCSTHFFTDDKRMASRANAQKPAFRAVVFDLDGTLIDSYDAIAASVNHVRSFRGLPPLSQEEVRRYVGRGAEFLMRDTIPVGDLSENVQLYKDHHPGVMLPLTRVLPEVAETLAALNRRHMPLAVCSNKPVAFSRELLEHLELSKYFTIVIGPEDAPRPKPAPDMLIEAVNRLALPRSEVLYVGDMVIDILTARSAGLAVWVIPTGSEALENLEAAKPDRLMSSFSELKSLG
jgi:2-phosphoglycolate phosphatase